MGGPGIPMAVLTAVYDRLNPVFRAAELREHLIAVVRERHPEIPVTYNQAHSVRIRLAELGWIAPLVPERVQRRTAWRWRKCRI